MGETMRLRLHFIACDGKSRGILFGEEQDGTFFLCWENTRGNPGFWRWFTSPRAKGNVPFFMDETGKTWTIKEWVDWRKGLQLDTQFREFFSPPIIKAKRRKRNSPKKASPPKPVPFVSPLSHLTDMEVSEQLVAIARDNASTFDYKSLLSKESLNGGYPENAGVYQYPIKDDYVI